MTARPVPRDQFGALTHSFLARFFENEITSGTDDLKSSFFWLLAFLMAPGIFMPVMRMFEWDLTALFQGYEVLQVLSRGDKAFYLGFTMVATALVGAIAWSSLLMDRRDGLILGAMPVRPAVVVQAKLAALGAYILLIALGMHTLAAVAFGTLLGSHAPFMFMLRSVAAHFVVPCAATALVVLAIAAAQGVSLAIAGPRAFARVSALLQLGLVGTIVLGLLALPVLNISVVDTLQGTGRNVRPWVLQLPPVWFLGAYEWILGARDPLLMELARKAVLALAAVTALTLVSFPIAYRRLMISAVETGAGFGRTGRFASAADLLARSTARRPQVRAVAQFFLSTLARAERHRFVLATSLGIAAAWGLPSLFALVHGFAEAPTATVLSLPLAAMTFLLVGLRTAAALPADVKAGWLFDLHGPTRRQTHVALERTMFIAGVLPVATLCAPVYGWLWGTNVAAIHTLVSLATGAALIEMLLWRFEGMPCARLWDPERLKLGRRWALYLAGFMIITAVIPALERRLFDNVALSLVLILGLTGLAALVRYQSLRQAPRPVDDVDAVTGGVLNLE
jgi:hypothetical protein